MWFHSTDWCFEIGDEVLPLSATGAETASFKGRPAELAAAIEQGTFDRDRVYLYEMDSEDLFDHHHMCAWWVSRERRIFEVEPVGEAEPDKAWDPNPSWWSFPKAIAIRCFYDPE